MRRTTTIRFLIRNLGEKKKKKWRRKKSEKTKKTKKCKKQNGVKFGVLAFL
jgi:hypothetical protein